MNQLSVSTEVASKTTAISKPTREIAKIISNEHIKKLELREYCKMIECDLKEWQNKVQSVNSAIYESIRTKDEYKSKNKINIINSESLIQALNELNKYKCELKSIYITTEKILKMKMFKYKNIVSAYDSAWKNTLKDYNSNPILVNLLKFQQENNILKKEVEKQENLRACTETQFFQLKDRIQRKFLEKIVEFSKIMIQNKEFLNSQNQNKENEVQNNYRNFEFKIFKTDAPSLTEKPLMNLDGNDEENITSSIDISVFDDIMVPSENLESQILEEDVLIHHEVCDVTKDKEEDLEYLNNYEIIAEPNCVKTPKNTKKGLMQEYAKSEMRTENESQYFKPKNSKDFGQTQNENTQKTENQNLFEENFYIERPNDEKLENVGSLEKPKAAARSASFAALQQIESEEEISRDVQMECEESVSEESYDKQFARDKEEYDGSHQKTSSPSSEDLAPTGDNPDDSIETCRTSKGEQKVSFKPKCEPDKSDLKSFTGFFTMGSDNDPPTPSIFKLF